MFFFSLHPIFFLAPPLRYFNSKFVSIKKILDAGTSLKKREAKKLQDFISATQEVFQKLTEEKKQESRMKFLLEDLQEIKNNHILRLTSKFDQTMLDHFYKLIKAMTKGKISF